MKKIFVAGLLLAFSSFAHASKPLDEHDFRKKVAGFCKYSSKNINTLTTPVTGKRFTSPIFFKVNEIKIENERIWTRKTKLDVCAPLEKIDQESVKRFPLSKESSSYEVIGEVLLHESPKNTMPDGVFSLHFIEIKEGNKGKGYGSAALDLTIMLSKYLANDNNFYSTVRLQCSDYEGDRYLGDVPFRLSYYLDHGFSLTTQTLSFMNHIDFRHFINRFDEKTFKDFLKQNMTDFCVSLTGEKFINNNMLLKNLLNEAKLYAQSLNALKDDEKLQIAESNSSKVAQFQVLDRVFYDSKITAETQNQSGEWVYSMFLNVKEWETALEKRKSLLQIRNQSVQKKYAPNEIDDFDNFIRKKASELIPSDIPNKNRVKSVANEKSKKRNKEENKSNPFSKRKVKKYKDK